MESFLIMSVASGHTHQLIFQGSIPHFPDRPLKIGHLLPEVQPAIISHWPTLLYGEFFAR
jgi:hypothetical protein